MNLRRLAWAHSIAPGVPGPHPSIAGLADRMATVVANWEKLAELRQGSLDARRPPSRDHLDRAGLDLDDAEKTKLMDAFERRQQQQQQQSLSSSHAHSLPSAPVRTYPVSHERASFGWPCVPPHAMAAMAAMAAHYILISRGVPPCVYARSGGARRRRGAAAAGAGPRRSSFVCFCFGVVADGGGRRSKRSKPALHACGAQCFFFGLTSRRSGSRNSTESCLARD
eukprot:COSAG01_NODE_2202_length_8174_cov_44.528050_1_plen_225_part_00